MNASTTDLSPFAKRALQLFTDEWADVPRKLKVMNPWPAAREELKAAGLIEERFGQIRLTKTEVGETFQADCDLGCTPGNPHPFCDVVHDFEVINDEALFTSDVVPEPRRKLPTVEPPEETPEVVQEPSEPEKAKGRPHKSIKLRYSGTSLDGNYTKVPNSVLDDSKVSIGARFVMVWLLRHQDGWETSAARMATALGINRRTGERHLVELETAGYLKRGDTEWVVQICR